MSSKDALVIDVFLSFHVTLHPFITIPLITNNGEDNELELQGTRQSKVNHPLLALALCPSACLKTLWLSVHSLDLRPSLFVCFVAVVSSTYLARGTLIHVPHMLESWRLSTTLDNQIFLLTQWLLFVQITKNQIRPRDAQLCSLHLCSIYL